MVVMTKLSWYQKSHFEKNLTYPDLVGAESLGRESQWNFEHDRILVRVLSKGWT